MVSNGREHQNRIGEPTPFSTPHSVQSYQAKASQSQETDHVR